MWFWRSIERSLLIWFVDIPTDDLLQLQARKHSIRLLPGRSEAAREECPPHPGVRGQAPLPAKTLPLNRSVVNLDYEARMHWPAELELSGPQEPSTGVFSGPVGHPADPVTESTRLDSRLSQRGFLINGP